MSSPPTPHEGHLQIADLAQAFREIEAAVDRHLSRLIAWAFRRWTKLDVRDYTTLLGLTSGYTVCELRVSKNSWMAHKQLDELNLPDEGVTVLAIQHASGEFISAPRHNLVVRPRDKLILYGRAEQLGEIGGRQLGALGDQAHHDAVDSQSQILLQQDQRESIHTTRRVLSLGNVSPLGNDTPNRKVTIARGPASRRLISACVHPLWRILFAGEQTHVKLTAILAVVCVGKIGQQHAS